MSKPDEHFIPAVTAVAQQVGGELIVLDLASERYLAIDKVGALIWEQLAAGDSLQTVVDTIVERFRVEPERVEADVDRFIASLEQLGLGARSVAA